MFRTLTILAVCLLLSQPAVAADPEKPSWTTESALAAIDDAASRDVLDRLYRLAREGRGPELLAQVERIATGHDRPDPERDRILYSLAASLGDLGQGTVGPEVLEYLATTRANTLVPHEEHPGMGVPLYNIRAAATGALAQWRRNANPLQPSSMINTDRLISELKSTDHDVTPERLRQARVELAPMEIESIIAAVPVMPDHRVASLVLAELAPGAVARPAVSNLLFELLEHRELGATAALALGRGGDRNTLAQLADLAARNDGLASRRASLAIDLYLNAGRDR